MFVCVCRSANIHAEAPDFVEMSTDQDILVTGIKVVDLIAPYAKGGKIGKCLSNGQCVCLRAKLHDRIAMIFYMPCLQNNCMPSLLYICTYFGIKQASSTC